MTALPAVKGFARPLRGPLTADAPSMEKIPAIAPEDDESGEGGKAS